MPVIGTDQTALARILKGWDSSDYSDGGKIILRFDAFEIPKYLLPHIKRRFQNDGWDLYMHRGHGSINGNIRILGGELSPLNNTQEY